MQDRTLFRAKKIVTKSDRGWNFEINIMFNGKEFSLTDIPITIDGSDAEDLIPGIDIDAAESGDVHTDVIDIESPYQFNSVFNTTLTDEVAELLSDVYSGRHWSINMMDSNGKAHSVSSYLADSFADNVITIVSEIAPCWIELTYTDIAFNEDWTLDSGETHVIFSNMHNGMSPLSFQQISNMLNMFTPVPRYNDREDFSTSVMKQGNSMVIKVTDQCRRMRLEVGDEIEVTLRRNSPIANTDLRALEARKWTPIDDPDSICHRNGCDLNLVQKFLDDFQIIGTVNPGMFKPAWYESPHHAIFDHVSFFKTRTGENLIVSQPYSSEGLFEQAQEWARKNGCTVEDRSKDSWHWPSKTSMFVFKKMENPDWRLPDMVE